jgi:hypothetical protein
MPIAADLIVEDGTGLATANSYVSLATATTYNDLRGNVLWAAASESDKVVALIRATDYLDTRWKWQSVRDTDTQALQFPRESLYNTDGADVSGTVPMELEDACCEYALVVLGDGTTLIDLSPAAASSSDSRVTYQRDKVGSLETETRYDSDLGPRITVSYPQADRIVKASRYTQGGGVKGTIR